MRIAKSIVAAIGSLACALAFAQAVGPSQSSGPKHDDPPPAQTAPGVPGIQGQNIFEVKPEVKPDASSDPKYMQQNNAERNRVQPGNNAPMYRDIVRGAEGYTNYPKNQDAYREIGVLIQPPVQYPGSGLTTAGEAWRQVRNNWILPYGGSLLLIVLAALGIFYFTRGKIGHHDARDGARQIERFTAFERAAHWANAIAFVILAISGIVMAFGKFFILPIFGGAIFGPVTWFLKTLHNFVGPLFAVSLAIMFFTFVRDNWPQKGDLRWMLRAGGLFSRKGEEPPSNRFNAGEKVVFWGGVLVLGSIVVGSGLVLDKLIPNVDYTRGTMQVAHMVHAIATVLMMCMIAGHIYIGTVGMRGAYAAMRHGWVGEEWAREHHAYWYEDIASGKIPAVRSQQTATSPVGTGTQGATT